MGFWESLWDIFWWTVWVFAVVTYLWAVFAIVTDLFRDHETRGWKKAVWIIALVFVPFITMLIYLIARGEGMSRRATAHARVAQEATAEYIRQASGTSASAADEINKAKALLDAGTITQAEYESIKAKALAA